MSQTGAEAPGGSGEADRRTDPPKVVVWSREGGRGGAEKAGASSGRVVPGLHLRRARERRHEEAFAGSP